MIEQLPEGNSIGWMQAPPQWIFTHTVRFIGVVRIVIQDGEGFILIKRGKPVYYYFKHGRIELKGHSALDYFNSHPIIEFNLCKYTPEEFALAMKICNVEEEEVQEQSPAPKAVFPAPIFEKPIPASPTLFENSSSPVIEPALPEPVADEPEPVVEPKRVAEPEPISEQDDEPESIAEPERVAEPEPVVEPEQVPEQEDEPEPIAEPERVVEPEPVLEPELDDEPEPVVKPKQPVASVSRPVLPPLPIEGYLQRPLFRSAESPVEMPASVPQPILLEESDIKLIGQIKKLNGVVAISVFNDERNILLMGDVDIEPLLKIARNMLATTRKISPRVEWGAFVHMTLQTPEGNIIIAPYYDVYLCLFTTRTINIGHIRRILRDLQLTKKIQD